MTTLSVQDKVRIAREKFGKKERAGNSGGRPGQVVTYPLGAKKTEDWLKAGGPAVIRGIDRDGNVVTEMDWVPDKLNPKSSISGNVTSRPAFRAEARAEAGIARIEVIPFGMDDDEAAAGTAEASDETDEAEATFDESDENGNDGSEDENEFASFEEDDL